MAGQEEHEVICNQEHFEKNIKLLDWLFGMGIKKNYPIYRSGILRTDQDHWKLIRTVSLWTLRKSVDSSGAARHNTSTVNGRGPS